MDILFRLDLFAWYITNVLYSLMEGYIHLKNDDRHKLYIKNFYQTIREATFKVHIGISRSSLKWQTQCNRYTICLANVIQNTTISSDVWSVNDRRH